MRMPLHPTAAVRGNGGWLGALTVTVRFSQVRRDTLILLLSQKRRVSLVGWVGASHLQLGGERPRQGKGKAKLLQP